MDDLDLVSVIIPFLNGSEWLLEAIGSVLNQTYPCWELILIDDGSDEVHSAVGEAISAQHPDKMKYIEHPLHVNRGVSISRNEAAKFAKGKFLAFLDADDVWFPNKLSDQLEMFQQHPGTEVVFGAFTIWQSWQGLGGSDFIQYIGAPAGIYKPQTLNTILYPFTDGPTPPPSGIMIRKDCFERIGKFESAFSGIYELYEDQAFLSKVFLQANVFISGTSHLRYRRRSGSMSSAANDPIRYQEVRSFYANWFENYLHEEGIADRELLGLIKSLKIPVQSGVSNEFLTKTLGS